MSVQALKQVQAQVTADGIVTMFEMTRVKRAALRHDNAVDANERAFLRDELAVGFLAEPFVKQAYQQLAFFGERSIATEMTALRQQKVQERWFNAEYLTHAQPLVSESTDTIGARMTEAYAVARETRMFNSDLEPWGRQILLNSHDPIAERLVAAKRFKREVSLFNSDYKDLAVSLIRSSYDRPDARRQAVADLDRDVSLSMDERESLLAVIEADEQG